MITEGLAQRLTNVAILTYDSTGAAYSDSTSWPTFVEMMPASSPDQAVSLTTSGGGEPDSLLPYDEPIVQVRVRGTADPRVSRAQAARIYAALNGLSDLTLPDGTYLVLAVPVQSAPQSIGMDDLQRHEHVFDLKCEIYNPTDNRQKGGY